MEYSNQPNPTQGPVWPPPPTGVPPPSYGPNLLGTFQPLTGRAKAAVIAIATTVTVDNIGDLIDALGPRSMSNHFGQLESIVGLTAAIIYLSWVYRAYRDLSAVNSGNVRSTPAWAVGYYFIPILALYKPFQIAQEMYRSSNSDLSVPPSPTVPGFLLGWWLCHIAAQTTGLTEEIVWNHAGKAAILGSACLDITMTSLSGWLACRVINLLTSRIEARYQALTAAPVTVPWQ